MNRQKSAALTATKNPPAGGDYVWDGESEDDRPLTKEEMHASIKKSGGRPRKENPKQPVTIRLSPEVTDYFRATGKGWQTRMDEVLRDYVASEKHPHG